ncbi:MAG: hypothetical protein R8G66_20030 [Cytophagales bacterium]|nr:hypothetical protein [Cytophagales bacterium]
MTLAIIEVTNSEDIEKFHQIQRQVYHGDHHWISPFYNDVEATFDPSKNDFHQHGIIRRWIAIEEGKCVGRVAAFVNLKRALSYSQPTGGMGFFESINDQEVAFALFDVCKDWLASFGIQAMDGPINFGENNAWWGLVVNGFTQPIYKHNYNPPYYQEFFESYGFKKYFDQYYYTFDLTKGFPKRYQDFAKKWKAHGAYTCRMIDLSQLDRFARDFMEVYNQGWVTHDNFKGMSQERAIFLFKKMKPIIDPQLIWFLYHEEQPIGFTIMIPEINSLLAPVKSATSEWLRKLLIKAQLVFNQCKVAYGFVLGFVPEYQCKGLEGLLFSSMYQQISKTKKYKTLKIGWAGDFNPKVVNMYRKMGFEQTQTSRTYRYLFDSNLVFERSPIVA